MLHLYCLAESKKINFQEDDMKFFIVRKPVNGIPKGFIHVPQLSPSLKLFEQVKCFWKEGIFTEKELSYLKENNVDMNSEKKWFILYEREFKKELKERTDMVKAVNRLKELLDQQKNIYLFCFCKDVDFCHRRLVGEHIESFGYKVNYNKINLKEDDNEQLSLF